MDKWLSFQFETQQRAEQMKIETDETKDKESNIIVQYYFEQFNSPRCWKTARRASEEWARVRSCRLDIAKEQIHIRYSGLRIEDTHHPWLGDGHTYTA